MKLKWPAESDVGVSLEKRVSGAVERVDRPEVYFATNAGGKGEKGQVKMKRRAARARAHAWGWLGVSLNGQDGKLCYAIRRAFE